MTLSSHRVDFIGVKFFTLDESSLSPELSNLAQTIFKSVYLANKNVLHFTWTLFTSLNAVPGSHGSCIVNMSCELKEHNLVALLGVDFCSESNKIRV